MFDKCQVSLPASQSSQIRWWMEQGCSPHRVRDVRGPPDIYHSLKWNAAWIKDTNNRFLMCFQASHFPLKNTISIDDWCCNSNLSGSWNWSNMVRYLKLGRANGSRRICQWVHSSKTPAGRSNGRFYVHPSCWLAMNIDEHDTVDDHVGKSSRFVVCVVGYCWWCQMQKLHMGYHQSWWKMMSTKVPCCLDSVASHPVSLPWLSCGGSMAPMNQVTWKISTLSIVFHLIKPYYLLTKSCTLMWSPQGLWI